MSERRTVYVTKYALTDGIRACTINEEWSEHCEGGRIYVDLPGCLNKVCWLKKDEYVDSLDAAQERAREMARARLKSLDKQRKKLEAIVLDGVKVAKG